MIARAAKDAAGCRQAARQAGAIGHGVEGGQLSFIRRVVGNVAAGKVAHQQGGFGGQKDRRDGLPVGGLHAKAVHAGIQLHPERVAGQRFQMPGDLFQAAEHRGQIIVADHFRRSGQMPRQDRDLWTRTKDFAQRHAFGRMGHEKPPRPGPRQRKTHLGRAQSVGIGLDHASGLDARRGQPIQRAPVLGNGVKVNIQGRGSHAVLLTQPGAGSSGNIRAGCSCPQAVGGQLSRLQAGGCDG